MKKRSTLVLTLCGGSLLLGCSSMSPRSQTATSASVMQSRYDSADAAYRAGRQLHRQSRFNEAAVAYQDALKLDASHIETKNGLAALVAGRGDLDRAIAMLTSLVDEYPYAPHIQANLGYAYYLKGDIAAASQALDQAIRMAPDDEPSWGKLAAVLDLHRLAGPKVQDGEADPGAAASAELAAAPVAASDEALRIEIAPVSGGYAMRYLGAGSQAASLSAPALLPTAMPVSESLQGAASGAPPIASNRVASNRVASNRVAADRASPGTALALTDALPLELSNGNGVRGLARALREAIKGEEWQVVRIINHSSFNVPATRIEYADSYFPAARLLARQIGVDVELRPHYRVAGAALRVVLGHDFKSLEAMRERHQNLPLACSSTMLSS